MSFEPSSKSQSISEISHLFLSGIREKHNNGSPRPIRIGPGQIRPAAEPLNGDAPVEPAADAPKPRELNSTIETVEAMPKVPPVSAVLAAHLNERQFECVKDYARHLASIHGRVGLIELGATEFRLMSFEAGHSLLDPELEEIDSTTCQSPEDLSEALAEMNWDVDRWLVLIPNPRTAEARTMLAGIDHWVLLSGCDHEGVVASYRALKGFSDLHRPRLSLALLDGADETETRRVYGKLSGVCQQFLNWELEDESVVHKSSRVAEHLVVYYRSDMQAGVVSAPPWWNTVADFVKNLKNPQPESVDDELRDGQEIETDMTEQANDRSPEQTVSPSPIAGPRIASERAVDATAPVMPTMTFGKLNYPPSEAPKHQTFRTFEQTRDDAVDVLDVDSAGGPESILTAILQQNQGEMVECPIRAPLCAGARLAVTRDRGLIMLAVAGEGLSDLRAIGHAYRWVAENRSLIGMAVPQFAIDPARPPRLRLLVEHGDVSAGVLQPILQSEHISVQAYRRLRWGGKTGLFLEAA
jgi:hypothetical protein